MNKKYVIIAIAVVAVIGLMLGIYFGTRPEVQEGSKSITVVVVHADKTEKTFTYKTDAEFLDDVLVEKGLISGYEDTYGLIVVTVDGEKAEWDKDNAFWSIYMDGKESSTGISAVPVYDGSTYKLEYTPIS